MLKLSIDDIRMEYDNEIDILTLECDGGFKIILNKKQMVALLSFTDCITSMKIYDEEQARLREEEKKMEVLDAEHAVLKKQKEQMDDMDSGDDWKKKN